MTDPVLAVQGRDVRAAATTLRTATTAAKDAALRAAADALRERGAAVLQANVQDVAAAESAGRPPAAVDRLRLDPARLDAMAAGLEAVASLQDPVGEVVDGWVRVGHGRDGDVSAGRGCPRPRGDVLGVFASGGPQVHVRIDEAGHDDQACAIQLGQPVADPAEPPFADHEVADGVDARVGIKQPRVTDDQGRRRPRALHEHVVPTHAATIWVTASAVRTAFGSLSRS